MRRQVTVTVADSHAGELDAVAGRLARSGMKVDQVLSTLGIVTGTVEDEQIAAVRRLPGVRAVEQQTTFQLPPPDADVQ